MDIFIRFSCVASPENFGFTTFVCEVRKSYNSGAKNKHSELDDSTYEIPSAALHFHSMLLRRIS